MLKRLSFDDNPISVNIPTKILTFYQGLAADDWQPPVDVNRIFISGLMDHILEDFLMDNKLAGLTLKKSHSADPLIVIEMMDETFYGVQAVAWQLDLDPAAIVLTAIYDAYEYQVEAYK